MIKRINSSRRQNIAKISAGRRVFLKILCQTVLLAYRNRLCACECGEEYMFRNSIKQMNLLGESLMWTFIAMRFAGLRLKVNKLSFCIGEGGQELIS